MTQSPDHLNRITIAARAMRLLVSSPAFAVSAPDLLQMASEVIAFDGAACVIFELPDLAVMHGLERESLPSVTALQAALAESSGRWNTDLPPALKKVAFYAWALLPLIIEDRVIGALVLATKKAAESLGDLEPLESVRDALAILAHLALREHKQAQTVRKYNEFLRFATHDLRSPLTTIQGFAGMMDSRTAGDLTERQAYYVQKILSGVNELAFLVDNIQDAGRFDPETGFYEMDRSVIDLAELVKKVVESRIIPATKRNFHIEHEIADDLPVLNVDAIMLERAITNLIDNAIKYTHQDGHVLVRAARDGDSVFVSVKDDGVGVAPEHFEKLFERNYRVQRQDKKVKGSGLGLFIVRSVARRHNGDAWVESVEGHGSTFFIRIPLSGANLPSAVHNSESS